VLIRIDTKSGQARAARQAAERRRTLFVPDARAGSDAKVEPESVGRNERESDYADYTIENDNLRICVICGRKWADASIVEGTPDHSCLIDALRC